MTFASGRDRYKWSIRPNIYPANVGTVPFYNELSLLKFRIANGHRNQLRSNGKKNVNQIFQSIRYCL